MSKCHAPIRWARTGDVICSSALDSELVLCGRNPRVTCHTRCSLLPVQVLALHGLKAGLYQLKTQGQQRASTGNQSLAPNRKQKQFEHASGVN